MEGDGRRRWPPALGRWSARLRLPTLLVGLVLLLVWEGVARRYGAYVLPPPAAVLDGLGTIVRTGEIWRHTGASLYRITAGFGLRALLDLVLDGGAGGDRLTGGDGDDTLLGGTENDTILGGPGNDTIDSGLGADTMTGGAGTDTYGCLTFGDVVTPDAGDPVPPFCP